MSLLPGVDDGVLFLVAGIAMMVVSIIEVAAMVAIRRNTADMVNTIEQRATMGLVKGLQDPEVKKVVLESINGAIDQDFIEAWAATAILSITSPDKPYLKKIGDDILRHITASWSGRKGANQKEVNEMTGEATEIIMDNTGIGAAIGSFVDLIPEESRLGKSKMLQGLRDPDKVMNALGALNNLLPFIQRIAPLISGQPMMRR